MRPSLLTRLRGWPRRAAAAVCLLLAAVTTLAHPHGAHRAPAAPRRSGMSARLAPGQLAVPVAIADSASAGWVRAGDRVGLLAGPASSDLVAGGGELLADHLRVLAAHRPGAALDPGASAEIVVAAGRADALRIAAAADRPVVPVLDGSG